jgi:hypothetical protein
MSAPSVLCTFPGKYGDLLWALPTVRALADAYGGPVDLLTSERYSGLNDLISRQPYIRHAMHTSAWVVQDTAPMSPRVPPIEGGAGLEVHHLGYEGWPLGTLAQDIWGRVARSLINVPLLDLDRPWITVPGTTTSTDPYVWVGWSEEHFELKVGILVAVAMRFPTYKFWWVRPWGGRYDEVDRTTLLETGTQHHRLGPNVAMMRGDWSVTAQIAQGAQCYLGCLSSQWVLANALGKRCVVVEPNEHRWHPVFYRDAPQNHLVRGNDGRPTFDARHAGDVLEEVLRG